MARQNRLVVRDGIYHVTSRIAHREFLLADPDLKDRIVTWMYGIADFAGIEVLAWSVMDNHIHLLLHVPPVPETYWTAPEEGTRSVASAPTAGTVPSSDGPATEAFSMRPRECRAPRWQPDLADLDLARRNGEPLVVSPAGDAPSGEAVRRSLAEGVPVVTLPRPATGFDLPEPELRRRIVRLYDGVPGAAEALLRRRESMAASGRIDELAAERDALLRRMYNVSRYMQTLKQRISQHLNARGGHEGQLWGGRFHSGLVEDELLARVFTAAYIDWNAPKAKLAKTPAGWRWCSFATACGSGRFASKARAGYERAFGCGWEEAKARLEAIFAERLPDTYDPGKDRTHYVVIGKDGKRRMVALTLSQLVKSAAKDLFRGAFFSRRRDFAKRVAARLPFRFPAPPAGVLETLGRLVWKEPGRRAA